MRTNPPAAASSGSFTLETFSLVANETRRVLHNDQEHIVADVVAARAMELNGGYVPAAEFAESVPDWEHAPLPIGHPVDTNGNYISARIPEVLEHSSVGHFQNVTFNEQDDELAGKVWVNVSQAMRRGEYGEQIVAALENGDPLEVSTAYRADFGSPGVYDGQFRDPVRVNIRPDHLALLPGDLGPGKCSAEEGCGVNAPLAPNDAAGHDAPPAPYSAQVIDVDATAADRDDVAPVCLNTATQINDELDTPNSTSAPTQDQEDAVGIAQRILSVLNVSPASVMERTGDTEPGDTDEPETDTGASETDPDSEADPEIETESEPDEDCPCSGDQDGSNTDSTDDPDATEDAGEPTPPEQPPEDDTPNPMSDTIKTLAAQTEFSVEELEAMDESSIDKLSDALLDANECGDDCDCDDCATAANESPEDDVATDPDDLTADVTVDANEEILETVNKMVETVDGALTEIRETQANQAEQIEALQAANEAEEQSERDELIEEISSNTDAYPDEELDEMSTASLRATAELVAPDEPKAPAVNAGSGKPGLSGTDLSALKPTKSVGNSDSDDDEDLPTPGSLAGYMEKQAEDN